MTTAIEPAAWQAVNRDGSLYGEPHRWPPLDRAREYHEGLGRTIQPLYASQPEAREEALGNLLAVIHGDGGHRALEVGTKQAALEAEKIVARLLSSAPEAREGDQPKLTVWYGEMPESNGRRNWTATIRRVNPTDKWDQGFCFARSEYPDRVRYEADRMRWIIGELVEKPNILAYDADLHSGYVAPAAPSADKLREFGQHTNLELSYRHGEEGDDGSWQVHRVNGGVNDREWTLIGSGATPADAIDQALAALKAEGAK